MPIVRSVYFDAVRSLLFDGRMNQKQVEGQNVILREWEAQGLPDHRWLAYILATTFLETGYTMEPIYEIGRRSYFDKYEPGTRIGKRLGNTAKGDGYRYRGRGFVQITGRANYEKMGRILGLPLVNEPDLALEPDVAAQIIIEGMTKGESFAGDFTGHYLGMYIKGDKCDYVGARRIVNGTDRAELIAGYARKFQEALDAAESAADGRKPAPVPEDPDRDMRPLPAPEGGKHGIAAAIAALIAFAAFVASKVFGLW